MDSLLNMIAELWNTPANIDEKMNDLKRKWEKLNARKQDTQSRMETELHPKKKLKKEVELWFMDVERINGEINDLQQKIVDSNVFSRVFLKQYVFKKIQEAEELFQEGKFHDGLVIDNPGWIGQALSSTKPGWIGKALSMTTLFGEAAKICMEQIWAYLMDDDIQKIGVWGMGGVGKTTIMKLIHNQLLKETENFDIVIWVTVSKEMSVTKLQNCIACAMKVTLNEDEDETVRAGIICKMLAHKGKFVLILDNLWDKLSLEEVGIPELSNGNKLLVTTQFLDVCHYLDCPKFRVPTLSKPDGWGLFLEKVGPDVLNHLDLLPIVESVAEECDGLPLAIVTIASSMRDVRNVHEWRNALHELKRHVKSVDEIEEKVFQLLKFTYDRLQDEKVKQCFLCCALYPEDCEIDTDELIKLWIAEGLVEEMDSMQIEIDKGHSILNKLKNSCLIENGTVDRNRVKLHDIVRDTALRITSVKPLFLVRAGMELKEIPDVQDWNEHLEKVSLMENWQLQIPYKMPPPECQKLTTLLFSKCSIQSIPECFFEQMQGLKILDLSYNPIRSLPNSISNLEILTTLLLGWCEHLEKMPSFSKLQALKKLDLRRTNIKDIPHGMERLVNLRYLDLSETRITEIPCGILAKFTSLQHLAINNPDKKFVRGEEIGRSSKLGIFQGWFDDLNEFNKYAQALHTGKGGPRDYRIYVGDQPEEDESYGEPEKFIELNGCNMCTDGIKILSDVKDLIIVDCNVDLCEEKAFFSWFTPVPHNICSSLSRIEIFYCHNIKKLFLSNWVLQNLQNLDILCVRGCKEMEEIIASESESEEKGIDAIKFTLPKLRWLELYDLPKLKSICSASEVMVCDSIEKIYIGNCPKLKRIPLNLPLRDDGQPSPPYRLRTINAYPEKWWELVEWDHPNAKSLLEPYIENWPVL